MNISTSVLRFESQVLGARESFLRRVRGSGQDDLGQPAVRFVSASGGEPLRDLLRRARPREEVILGSQALFDRPGPFREFGPIYVSAEGGPAPRSAQDVFDGDYFRSELVLRRYDHRHWIVAAVRVRKEDAPERIEEWLHQTDTAFVDARFPEYGCFACRFTNAEVATAEE